MSITVKPIILIFTSFYLPGYRGGGPIRSIANMVERLGNELDFRIVTMDRDLGDQYPYESIEVDAWNQVGQARVFYASPSLMSLWSFSRLMRDTPHDVLYLNSFFDTTFTLTPLLARRFRLAPHALVVLAPRGEFSEGAFKLKRWKKVPFTQLVRWIGVFDRVHWHASTTYEVADIRRVMGQDVIIRTAIDLAMTGCDIQPVPRGDGSALRVIFISRISPIKNLLGALSVLRNVRQEVRFDVYGPVEDEAYWAECHKAAAVLPANVVFTYCGALEPLDVAQTLAKYDLFLFPTFGENYGHVIAEALSVGLPVLISDTTPWRNLEQNKLGWDIPLKQSARFVARIEECCVKQAAAYDQWRREIRLWAVANIGNQNAVDENRRLFSNLD